MSTLLGLIMLLSAAAWMLVKRYERHLDAQLEPWLASELSLQRVRPRVMRRRPAGDR
jgi:hypothetical protein